MDLGEVLETNHNITCNFSFLGKRFLESKVRLMQLKNKEVVLMYNMR